MYTNLKSGKRNDCFGKSLEKVLNFASKNLYGPCDHDGPVRQIPFFDFTISSFHRFAIRQTTGNAT